MTMEADDSCRCCKCGISWPANISDICSACFNSLVNDSKQSLPPKQVTIQLCSQCDCYFHPPKLQMEARFGSKELMSFCVKSLKKMDFSLRNAMFVGTETDYSETKIIKVKLSLQKHIWSVYYIEQDHIIEYLVEDEICNSCSGTSSNLDHLVSSTQ